MRDAEECGIEWMGKEDEGSRGMGCNGLCLCLSYHLLFGPPYLCKYELQYNQYILNHFFEQYCYELYYQRLTDRRSVEGNSTEG